MLDSKDLPLNLGPRRDYPLRALKTSAAFDKLTSLTVIGSIESLTRILRTAIPILHHAATSEPTMIARPTSRPRSYGKIESGSLCAIGNQLMRKLPTPPRTAN